MDLPATESVLIAPLNWGLGHATRCIPIIKHYLSRGSTVDIASDGSALLFLQNEFPDLDVFELPSYGITYPEDRSMSWHMLKQYPKIRSAIRREEEWLAEHLLVYDYNLVISDNRYGFRNADSRSVFMTHQLKVISPHLSRSVNRLYRAMIHRFDECWVPDFQGENSIAGELSQQVLDIPTHYIGPLSRMKKLKKASDISLLAILSGPEPQRTRLEELLLPILVEIPGSVLVRGLMESNRRNSSGFTEVIDHADTSLLEDLMNRAERVVCRSGYSSIMDLIELQKNAILVPTPGQTEQEYLANRLKNSELFDVIEQDELPVVLREYLADLSPARFLS